MNPPKHILVIDTLLFALPDDFNGSLADALRLLAEYHDKVDNTPMQIVEYMPVSEKELKDSWETVRQLTFNSFMEALDAGRRLSARMDVHHAEEPDMNSHARTK